MILQLFVIHAVWIWCMVNDAVLVPARGGRVPQPDHREQGYEHGVVDHAPDADGVDHEELQDHEVGDEDERRERQRQHERAGGGPILQDEDQDHGPGGGAEQGDRYTKQHGVTRVLDRLTPAPARADQSFRPVVHPGQIGRNEEPERCDDCGSGAERAVSHPCSALSKAFANDEAGAEPAPRR